MKKIPILLLLILFPVIVFSQETPQKEEIKTEEAVEVKCATGHVFNSEKNECMKCGGVCDSGLPGICKEGVIDCEGDIPLCIAKIKLGEKREICNFEDDDCDGSNDEDFDKDKDGFTTCSGDCNDRDLNIYPDAPEKCNGIDDNCNGLTDEKFNVGGVCMVGVGECAKEGHFVCNAKTGLADCDAKPGKISREICDGKDNNCDGEVDESPPLQNCVISIPQE